MKVTDKDALSDMAGKLVEKIRVELNGLALLLYSKNCTLGICYSTALLMNSDQNLFQLYK